MVNSLRHPFLGFWFSLQDHSKKKLHQVSKTQHIYTFDWWHADLNEFPPDLRVGVEPPGRWVPFNPALLIEKVLALMEHVLDMLETVLDVGPVDHHPEPLADPGDDAFIGASQEPALGTPVPNVLLVHERIDEILVHLLSPNHHIPAVRPGGRPSIAAAGAELVGGDTGHLPRSRPQRNPSDDPWRRGRI